MYNNDILPNKHSYAPLARLRRGRRYRLDLAADLPLSRSFSFIPYTHTHMSPFYPSPVVRVRTFNGQVIFLDLL